MITQLDIITEKMRKFCVYRERSHSEVRSKLIKEKIFGEDLEEVMTHLIQEGFLNEERFAKSFVRGKFKQNKWGRNKILQELNKHSLSDYCIKKGLEEINSEAYLQTLKELKTKKEASIKSGTEYERKQKITRFLYVKGYELELINGLFK